MTPPSPPSAVSTHPCIGVVGAGYWGKHLIRNFYHLQGLAALCDARPYLVEQFQLDYPGVVGVTEFEALLALPTVQAVVIATPSHTHFDLAQQAIAAGKHVYVEKPMTTDLAQAETLAQLAQQAGVVLMVGHLLVHHPVVNRLKGLIEQGVLGTIGYLHSDRLNWNHGRADSSVLWDLAPHDLSMMMYLLGGLEPTALLAATGARTHPPDGKLDDTTVVYQFNSPNEDHPPIVGTIHTSWVYPKKQVQLMVKGSRATAIFDDTQPPEQKLQLIAHEVPGQWDSHFIPVLPLEPLKVECQHFINAVRDGLPVQTGIASGVGVTRWLALADQAMAL
jgi:UDP-2-acetamido-3-amino-2,3-dideoxy-glucuronate N-acetyltransferase